MNNTEKNYLVVSIDAVRVIRSFSSRTEAEDYIYSINCAGAAWGMPPAPWQVITKQDWERMIGK